MTTITIDETLSTIDVTETTVTVSIADGSANAALISAHNVNGSAHADIRALITAQNEFSEMDDVTITTPAANEVIGTSDGSTWINRTLAEAGIGEVANGLDQFASTTSAELAGVISNETGSGALVFGTSPTLVTPALGTPSALVLTNATGLPEAQVTAHVAAIVHQSVSGAGTNTHAQIDTHIAATAAHGISGAVVGTTDAQTLTNKTLTQPALTLTQGLTPTPTAEGVIEWDTDNNQIKIGDGVGTKVFSDDAGLSITESQISDLQAYILNVTGDPLGDLSDVTITANSDGEVLRWNGSAWINNTLAELGASAVGHTHATTDITSGTMADARIAESNVTQHVAAIVHQSVSGAGTNTHAQIDTHIAATAAHGISGAVVGTTDSQTLTNKTLTSPTLTLQAHATPTPTAEGDIWWDSDNDVIVVGDGVGQKIFSNDSGIGITESQITDLGTTVAMVADTLSVFAATTSSALAGVISDETGSGALVFGTSPTLVTPALGTPSALVLTNATGLPEAQVTTHQAALSITESQISDLQAYILNVTGDPLGDLSDVTITANSDGEVLRWNGAAWVNNTLAELGAAATVHTHTESDITDLQAYILNVQGDPLDDLSNVTITANSDGEVLRWNGSAWINNTLAELGAAATVHTHTESDISDLFTTIAPLASPTFTGTVNAAAITTTGAVDIQGDLELGGSIIKPGADATDAIKVTNAAGTTDVITVDTTNERVGIGANAPNYDLHLMQGTDTHTAMRIYNTSNDARLSMYGGGRNWTIGVDASDSGNFAICNSSILTAGDNAMVFDLDENVSIPNGNLTVAGDLELGSGIIKPDGDSTSAIQVTNAANTQTLLTFDSTLNRVVLDNNIELRSKDSAGTPRTVAHLNGSDSMAFGSSVNPGNTFVDGGTGYVMLRSGGAVNTLQATSTNNVIVYNRLDALGDLNLTGDLQLGTGIIKPDADGTAALKLTKADGTTAVVTVDTTNGHATISGISPRLSLSETDIPQLWMLNLTGGNLYLDPETVDAQFQIRNQANSSVFKITTSSGLVELSDDLVVGNDLGVQGDLDLDGIPTSDPTHTGRVWSDSGTLKISAG